jgi:hypothetical protein
MRIGRTVIIPAILALGVAGSALAAPAAAVAAVHAPSIHTQTAASSAACNIFYRG